MEAGSEPIETGKACWAEPYVVEFSDDSEGQSINIWVRPETPLYGRDWASSARQKRKAMTFDTW
jgi:hypothetical protein